MTTTTTTTAVAALDTALTMAAFLSTIVARIRAVAETDAANAQAMSNCMLAIFQTQLPADGAHLERTRQALPPSSSFVGGWVTAEEAHAQLDALAAALASDVAAMQQLQLRLRLRL
jgi:hypothetical protein